MNKRPFNWDHYLKTAGYREIVDRSPALSHDRPPTMYSPDGALLYLASQDIDVSTNDISALKRLLPDVLDTFRCSNRPVCNKRRLAAMTDCYEICGLLVKCGEDSDEYRNPDSLLIAAITE